MNKQQYVLLLVLFKEVHFAFLVLAYYYKARAYGRKTGCLIFLYVIYKKNY